MKKFNWLHYGERDDEFGGSESPFSAHKTPNENWSPKFHFDLPKDFAGASLAVIDFGFVGPLQPTGPAPAVSLKGLSAPQRPSFVKASGGDLQLSGGGPIAQASGTVTQQQVDDLEAGYGQALAKIEADIVAQVWGDTLPLLGDNLGASAAAPLHFVARIKDAIVSGLGSLTGSATYTDAQVDTAIENAVGAAGIAGSVNVTVSGTTDVRLNFITSQGTSAFTVPLELNLGLPGLNFALPDIGANVQAQMSHSVSFGGGLDAQGFYIDTSDSAVLTTNLNTVISGLDATNTKLALLRYNVKDEPGTDGDGISPSTFYGSISFDLIDPGGGGDRLRIDELGGSDVLDAKLNGVADINLEMVTDLPGTAALPKFRSDFQFDWSFNNAPMTAGDMNAGFGNVPSAAFKNVALDLGTFFSTSCGRRSSSCSASPSRCNRSSTPSSARSI